VKEAPATEARDVAAARAWLKAQARASPWAPPEWTWS